MIERLIYKLMLVKIYKVIKVYEKSHDYTGLRQKALTEDTVRAGFNEDTMAYSGLN